MSCARTLKTKWLGYGLQTDEIFEFKPSAESVRLGVAIRQRQILADEADGERKCDRCLSITQDLAAAAGLGQP